MHSDVGQFTVLRALQPAIEQNLARHRAEFVQWRPCEFAQADAHRRYARSTLTETAKAALVANLLVEQNIPLYARDGATTESGAWSAWLTQWSATRTKHAAAITDYLVATRSVDPIALERARVQCMTVRIDTPMNGAHLLRSLVQVAVEESVTSVCHRNTASHCHDDLADRLLGRVASDQELHVRFFADLISAALDAAPALTVTALTEVVMNYQLPGTNLPGFARSAHLIALHGIFDLRRHLDLVLHPLLARWDVFSRSDLGAGERSRDTLAGYLDHLDAQAAAFGPDRIGSPRYADTLCAS